MDEWRKKVEELASADSWVMEGDYGSTFDIRFPRATQIIHMDFSKYTCLYRVIKRRFQVGKQVRPDMAEGCKERFEWNFYKYVWDYPKIYGPRVYKDIEFHNVQDKFLILKNVSDVKSYLEAIPK